MNDQPTSHGTGAVKLNGRRDRAELFLESMILVVDCEPTITFTARAFVNIDMDPYYRIYHGNPVHQFQH